MTPHPYISHTSVSDVAVAVWSRRNLGIFSLCAVALLLSLSVFKSAVTPDGTEAEKHRFARACTEWHLAASTVVSQLVHSTRDADLRQVNDSIFRMRRARRNCEAGWFELACQDYFAVAASTPSYAMTTQLFPCGRLAESADDRN